VNIGTEYKSEWLRTHGAIIGMTGSGKTGLGIVLMEEAALAGIPAIIIDPKGDLTNLIYQDKLNIIQTIYTPGSDVGVPVSILSSLKVKDTMAISSTVTSLLGIAGISADPMSKEHILLSTILESGDQDINSLINAIQSPPFDRLGVLPLETFYPEKKRYDLAIKLNSFLAAPRFKAWVEGVPLDIESMLWKDGKPCQAIFYLAHLNELERMFFVTLLYTAIEGWMRSRRGSTELEALVYFDEVTGYLPPVKNPPSKEVIIRMLKQARAYGVGLVLATQNPIDLDYKALSNIGTWMIGKLQTEQDKKRIIEGLEGKITNLATLGKREFLLHSIYQDQIKFKSRDAISRLVGPLSLDQIPKGEYEIAEIQKIKVVPSVPSKYRTYYHKSKGVYHGYIGGQARVTYESKKYNYVTERLVGGLYNGDWDKFYYEPDDERDYDYAPLDLPDLDQSDFENWIYKTEVIEIPVSTHLGIVGTNFWDEANKLHDQEKSDLMKKYNAKIDTLKLRLDKAYAKLHGYQQRLSARKKEQTFSIFEIGLSMMSGRKRSLSSSMSKGRMVEQDAVMVKQQQLAVDQIKAEWESLNERTRSELAAIREKWDAIATDVTYERIRPYKKDIVTEIFGVIWKGE
jgi:hypothetical protein